MDQGKDLVQEELNIFSAPVIENCQLSDNSASSSLDLRNEENKNSKVSDIWVEGSVTELQLQNIPLPSFAPQLGMGNLKDSKAANISAETHIKSLKEDQEDDFKLSDTHLLYKRNSTEIDAKSKKTGSSCPVEIQNISLPSFSPQLEIGNLQVTKTANISAETHIKSLKESRKVDFKLSDSHLPYKRNSTEIDTKSKKTGSSCRLKNVSFIDLTVTVRLPTSENVTCIDLTVNSDEEQQSDLHKASSALNTRKVSGKHVAKSRHMPYSAKLSRHTHLRTVSCVNQKSMDHLPACIDSRAVLIKNEKFDTTDSDKLSRGEDAELDLKPSSDLVRKSSAKKLEIKTDILANGKDTCQSNEPMNMSLHIEGDLDCPVVNDDSRSTSPVTETSLCFENMSLHVSEEDANLITEDVSSETAAAVASVKLPGDCEQSCSVSVNSLRNVQQQSGSAVNAASSVLSKNGSATNLSKNAQHASSVETNTVASMQQNSSVVHVHDCKGIQQQKNIDMTASTSNKIQRQTCNSADTFKNMPLSISNDSMKNIQNSSATSSSKDFQQTSKSASASKDIQKENCINVIPSNVQQRINATGASENKEQKVNATAALKKIEQKSSNAVDASKNKEQKVGNAITAAKSMQQRNSCATNSDSVPKNSNSALNKIRLTTSNTGNPFKTIQQQSGSSVCLDNVQPPKRIGLDIPKATQQENTCTKLSQTVQKQSGPVFRHPNVLRPSTQGENINSCTRVPSGKIDSSQNKISLKKTESKKSAPSLLSITNIQYQPLQDCQDLLELASCKTTDYRVQRGKPKHILEESSRANTFERFKDFQFSRATENDVLELYGRLPMSLPEDLEETPMCKEDITDFSSKKNKVQDLEKVLHNQRL